MSMSFIKTYEIVEGDYVIDPLDADSGAYEVTSPVTDHGEGVIFQTTHVGSGNRSSQVTHEAKDWIRSS